MPNSIKQVLEESSKIAKSLGTGDISTVTTTANTIIAPQDLSSVIPNLPYINAPLYKRIKKVDGVGTAFEFNKKSAIFLTSQNQNPRDIRFASGGNPLQRDTQYANEVVPYRLMGLKGGVDMSYQARMKTYIDAKAEAVADTMQAVMQAIEWLLFWDRSDVNNSVGLAGFKGLDQLITTNVVNAAGGVLTKGLIDSLVKKMEYQNCPEGIVEIYCSVGQKFAFDNIYNTKEQVIINNGESRTDLRFGNIVKYATTAIGDLEIIKDQQLNPGLAYPQGQPYSASSGPNGISLSTIFFVPTTFLDYVRVRAMQMYDLGITRDGMDFNVVEEAALALLAEPWAGKITNVAE